jgi:TolB-like protein
MATEASGRSPERAARAGAVFLSYASEDVAAAERIAAGLRNAGIEVWLDRTELRGGDAWDRRIHQQIHACRLFMPIVSAHTEARMEGYFRREWRLAVDRTHDLSERVAFLVPIVIDATPESKADVPEAFRAVQWTRLADGEPSAAFITRVCALLAAQPATAREARDEPHATASRAKSVRRPGPGWVALGSGALLVALLAGYFAWRLQHRLPDGPLAKSPAPRAAPSDLVPEKSLAVLPFVDMSEKHDQEYFADGLAEEILDQLARIGDLRVIARTSSFSFKGKPDDIPTIGRELRVASILEGSIRRSRSRVRVTTQLVRAATGEHIWSNSYERDFRDVLAIQTDIASSVAAALKATLLEHFNAAAAGTTSAEAYDLYLKALALSRHDFSESALGRIIELSRRALSMDPSYADAWALLSQATGDQAAYFPHPGKLLRDAEQFARRAIEAQPALPTGYVAYARSLVYDLNVAAARVQVEKALRLDPNDTWGLAWAGAIARFEGRFAQSVALMQRSFQSDPENPIRLIDLAQSLRAAGRYEEAESAYRRFSDAVHHDPSAIAQWASMRLDRGDPAGALQLLAEQDLSARASCGCRVLALERLGRLGEAEAALKTLEAATANRDAFAVAEVYARRGDADRAFRWLDAAVSDRNQDVLEVKWYPALAPIRSDGRYVHLLARLGLPP